jgi:hypothetical protein
MKRISILILLTTLAGLIWFSLHLASMRIYQVDECTEVYVARTLAMDSARANVGHVTLFQALLSPFTRAFSCSADLFTAARFVMVELFWLNLVLMALATGEKLFSLRGLIALVGAVTLAPLWDYGFEIRHDNLLLTGLLLMWCTVRLRPVGLQSYFIIGAMAAGLEFVAFKSFAYTVPISLAVLIFPPPGRKLPRWKFALAWVVGAAATFLIIRLIFGVLGLWELYLLTNHSLSAASSNGHRFWPWKTLARLLGQTPLLLALGMSALVALAVDLRRRGKAALSWEGDWPEGLLFLMALAVLMINPAPFAYNLLFLVPFLFLFAYKHALLLSKEISGRAAALLPTVVAVLIFGYLVPFAVATRRHLDWPNYRQVRLMYMAENLTDPAKDRIYDGIGMVPSRPIDRRWWLHSFSINSYLDGTGVPVRDLLAEKPPAVFIPSYRTDWLSDEDHAFIRKQYVPLADDFWVLGKKLPSGGGTFDIIHPGRYRIASLEGSDLEGTFPAGMEAVLSPPIEGKITATLDGVTFSNEPVELSVGTHRIECAADCQPTVVWVGPQLNRVGRQDDGDHRHLFFNWY